MDLTQYDTYDEDALFEAEARKIAMPSRKNIVLREKLNATGKQKLANQARFSRRGGRGSSVPAAHRRQRP